MRLAVLLRTAVDDDDRPTTTGRPLTTDLRPRLPFPPTPAFRNQPTGVPWTPHRGPPPRTFEVFTGPTSPRTTAVPLGATTVTSVGDVRDAPRPWLAARWVNEGRAGCRFSVIVALGVREKWAPPTDLARCAGESNRRAATGVARLA